MKNKLWGVLLVSAAMALTGLNAEAARMGGGKSFGRQSANVTQRQATPPAAPAQNPSAAPGAQRPATPQAAAPRRPWAGILGGLAAGLGLAWLAHSLGLGAGFGHVLLIGLLALLAVAAWRMVSASRRPAPRQGGFAFEGAGGPANPVEPAQYSPAKVGNDASARPWEHSGHLIGSALEGSQSWGVPAGFDTDGFLASAKRNFVALQDAWDRADIGTLRSMMTDGMVQEIQSQLSERERNSGGQPNKTDVVMLDAKLLGIEELPDAWLASVEFSGMIREDASAGPSPFREVWNMSKPVNGGGWLVAGVQALQ